jgi:hypothetical protein
MLKQNKKFILLILGVLTTLSVGYVVNSSNLGGGSKNENYSEALNKDFTGEVSTYNKDKFKILAPGEQFWDGLKPEEKEGKVLVVPKYRKDENGNIKYNEYENLEIEKKDKHGNGINGIQFCIAKDPKDITKGCATTYAYGPWTTGADGKLEIPTNELPLYTQTLIETGEIATSYKPQKIALYVDPGHRFLGEVKGQNEQGEEFITYNELLSKITGISVDDIEKKEGSQEAGNRLNYLRKISDSAVVGVNLGNVLNKGNDSKTGGNWLKIFDARKGTTLYIAKKPLTNNVSWNQLCSAGVVFGLDQVNADGTLKPHFKTPPDCGRTYKPNIIEIKGKRYIVRLLRGQNTEDPNTLSGSTNGLKVTGGSEWNRYILPLVKDYRYGSVSRTDIEQALKDGGTEEFLGNSKNFKIQLATYNWFEDLTLGAFQYYQYEVGKYHSTHYTGVKYKGQLSWTQEYANKYNNIAKRTVRGFDRDASGAAHTSSYEPNNPYDDKGFRPVLEEIPPDCYDGACFEGEVEGNKFISYKELIHEITGKPIDEIKDNESTSNGEITLGNKLP